MYKDYIKGEIYTHFGSMDNARQAVAERLNKEIPRSRFSEALGKKKDTPNSILIRTALNALIADKKEKERT